MAITIIEGATTVTPVYSIDGSNLTWVLDSTNSGLCSMKYVTDIYGLNSGSTAVVRLKHSPNTTNGMCTVSVNRVLENFVSHDFFGGLTGATFCAHSTGTYILRFGEESDGTFGCTGSSFSVSPNLAQSGLRYVFNGCQQYEGVFNVSDFLIIDNSTTQACRFLTNAPTDQVIGQDEEAYLYCLDRHTGGGTSLFLKVDIDYLDGSTASFYVTGNDTVLQFVKMEAWGVGWKNLNDAVSAGIVLDEAGAVYGSPIIDCDVESYGVTVVTTPF